MATVKFPSGMDPASGIAGNDKLMIAKATTGESFQATFDQAKEYLNITGIELEPLVGGTTSGTALVVPAGPAGENRKAQVRPGWYDFGGGPVEATADKQWTAFWNGSTWSLIDMGALPDSSAKAPQWIPATYQEGDIRFNNGLNYRANKATSSEPTPTSLDWDMIGNDDAKAKDWSSEPNKKGAIRRHDDKTWIAKVDTSAEPNAKSLDWEEIGKNAIDYVTAGLLHVQTDKNGVVVAFVDKDGKTHFRASDETKQDVNYLKKVNNALYVFTDKDERVVSHIDLNGRFHFVPSESVKPHVNYIEKIDRAGTYLTDANGVVFSGIDEKGNPIVPKDKTNLIKDAFADKKFIVTSPVRKVEKLTLTTIAKGRGVDVPLNNSGMTHPKVLYIPNGWNGYRFWMAITPTFGEIAAQVEPASYENPTIFCSNDGITWMEPTGISNPIDMPTVAPSYWSDTHLVLGDDGWMYCIYRGNWMTADYVGQSGSDIRRVNVYKKSRDGVNWSERKYMWSTRIEGLDDESGIMSPAIFKDGSMFTCYDVVKTTPANPYSGQNQTNYIVMRRSAKDLDSFGRYSPLDVVNFTNRPWTSNQDIWHIDVEKVGDIYFMLVATGNLNSDYADKLWMAYSRDGWTFTAFEERVSYIKSYRSSLTPISVSKDEVKFYVYNAESVLGYISLVEFTLKLKNIK